MLGGGFQLRSQPCTFRFAVLVKHECVAVVNICEASFNTISVLPSSCCDLAVFTTGDYLRHFLSACVRIGGVDATPRGVDVPTPNGGARCVCTCTLIVYASWESCEVCLCVSVVGNNWKAYIASMLACAYMYVYRA